MAQSRLRSLEAALDLQKEDDFRSKHHHLMRWWVKWDFDSLPGFAMRNLAVTWQCVADKGVARTLESDLLLAYKTAFADIPIGNLKSW